MTDERFDELMRDAAQTYNLPPDAVPLDPMWQNIATRIETRALHLEPRRRPIPRRSWFLVAATLVLGIALGRASVALLPGNPFGRSVAIETPSADITTYEPDRYDAATSEYLGYAAAMLVALPGELKSGQSNPNYFTRLDELLLQTRMLLDGPAGEDPGFRTLLEDLEVVLVQVVRLQADRDPMKIELLNEALEQRNVMPRLRNAVVSHIGD